jgi:rhodanese-related sulfurtransferase
MTPQTVIPVAEFKARLDKVRSSSYLIFASPDEFEAWQIEGQQPIAMLNIPQLDFIGEEEKYFERLPRDRKMVIVCAHGDASKYSAELLQREGFRAKRRAKRGQIYFLDLFFPVC